MSDQHQRASRFDKKTALTKRQLKTFDVMYLDKYSYSIEDIADRLGIHHGAITSLARERKLQMRTKGRPHSHDDNRDD